MSREASDRIEKALNGGNRFRRADVSDLLAEVQSLRSAMAMLAQHRTIQSVTYPYRNTTCAGYPGCHHCWAEKQLKHIAGPRSGDTIPQEGPQDE